MIPLRHALALLLAALAAPAGAAEWTAKQSAGPYVVELAVSPKPQVTETAMVFAITDESGKPVSTAKASGFANFSSGKLKGRATLRPDGVNRMKGYGLMSAKPDLSIEVSISFPDGPPLKVALEPLQ